MCEPENSGSRDVVGIVARRKQFEKLEDAQTLALAIVETIPEPFVVLDDRLGVIAANEAFYETFDIDPIHSHGRGESDRCT